MQDLTKFSHTGRQAARQGGIALMKCLAEHKSDRKAASVITMAYIAENRRLQAERQCQLMGKHKLTEQDLELLGELGISVPMERPKALTEGELEELRTLGVTEGTR